MNSLKYIGSQVDNILDKVSGEKEILLESQPPEHVTLAQSLWCWLISLLTFQWSPLAYMLRYRNLDSVQTEKIDGELSQSSSAEVPRKPKVRSCRSRTGRSSVSLLRRPIIRSSSQRKTLVLDLDETLIHSMSRSHGLSASHMVEVELANNVTCIYYVERRPHCNYFLSLVRQWYDLVVFTASVKSYADPMIDWLEQGQNIFSRRYYRSNCISTPTGYVKDLTVLGESLDKVFIIDNSPVSFSLQLNNGIGIEGWISDPSDTCLLDLLPLLKSLRSTSDVRSILCLQYGESTTFSFETTGMCQPDLIPVA